MTDSPADSRPLALFFSNLHGGGIQRVMLNLAEGFLQAGLPVDLVTLQAEGELLPAVPGGARLVDLKKRRALFALTGLMRYLQTESPRALLASQPHLNVLAILARGLARSSTRVVISEHIAFEDAARNAARWLDGWTASMGRIFYRRADGIVAVSHGVARQLIRATRVPPHMVRVIYNPILTPSFYTRKTSPVEHAWLAEKIPLILSAGRLTAQKDQATLLRAFAILLKSRPARLILLGQGEERAALLKLAQELKIENEVSLPGFVQNPFGFMARAKLFALSSRWEGFGNVLVEAMACGLPIVSTDCPSGPAEILAGGKFGLLTPPGDAPALAAAMLETLAHPISAQTLKTRAQDFSSAAIVPLYLQTLLPVNAAQRAGSGL